MEDIRLIEVKEEILADNIKVADGLRERLQKTKTMLINLMSSPGSGKTTLLRNLIVQDIAAGRGVGVIHANVACPAADFNRMGILDARL